MSQLTESMRVLEQLLRSRLGEIDAFNRDAPHVPGLALFVDGEAQAWPVDTERYRVLLALVGKSRRGLEQGQDPTRAELARLSAEIQAELEALGLA